MKTISKTVKVGGNNIKVSFSRQNLTNNTLPAFPASGTVANDCEFVINGATTVVKMISKATNNGKIGYRISQSFEVDGFNLGDSEKKVIEHILSR